MADISLLPEELRRKEDALSAKPPSAPAAGAGELRFSVPKAQDEDIEIIEVDEGELDQVLANEPILSRLAFKAQDWLQNTWAKLSQPKETAPPAKVPPQFFTPPPIRAATPPAAAKPAPGTAAALTGAPKLPTTGLPTSAQPAVAGQQLLQAVKPAIVKPAGTNASIVVPGQAPHRVRVIRRVRKPVNVSFVSNDALVLSRIDVPKRRFTFYTTLIVFVLLFGGSYAYIASVEQNAHDDLASVNAQLTDARTQMNNKQVSWQAFKDLEPQLKALGTLLDKHVSLTHLLSELEQVTLPNVSYGSLTLTAGTKLQLSVTADSYETAAEQTLAFRQASFIKSVDISSYTADYGDTASTAQSVPKAVKFDADLTLAPQAILVSTSTLTTAYAQ